MGLRFILGRAGTGKTYSCLEEIKGELRIDAVAGAPGSGHRWHRCRKLRIDAVAGAPLILLVPEQASFQMEKALTAYGDQHGIIRAQVMSFRRLGWLVFQEAGGTNRQYLDELGKMMTLRSVLLNQEKSLKIFHGMVREQGFIEKLAGTLTEFKSYNITLEQLQKQYQEMIDKGQEKNLLAYKLHDLMLIYQEFQEFIEGCYTDPDDYLSLLVQRISQAPSLKEARFWVDSFAGFTPQELQVIGSLMCHCRQVNLTLCLDSQQLKEEITEMDLFHPARVTYEQVCTLAHDLGVPLEAPKLLDRQGPALRFKNPALGWLEKNYDQHQDSYHDIPEDVLLVRAANRRVEVEGVAREIQRLAREKNYRYREMAIILREQENYTELISTIFPEYDLPFFLDAKKPVAHHPLIELIIAGLETVNSFWSYEPLFRYLKTDLVPISREKVDRLENYVLAHGIQGKLWLIDEPWNFKVDTDHPGEDTYQKSLYEDREEAVAVLRNFYQQVHNKGALQVKQITRYLYELLNELGVDRRLEAWCREAEAAGQLDVALEYSQIWDGVMELFDQLVAALGSEKMSLLEYAKVVEAGLGSLRLGIIPPALDQILIGSIERSRQPELKATFLLGINEGTFPARIKENEIFGDLEREELAARDLELAPTSKLRLFHEQYLAYIALTRGEEYLWASYPEADESGKQLMPSILINRLQELLPELKPRYLANEPGKGDFPVLDYLLKPKKAIAYLAEKFRQAEQGSSLEPFWLEVYHWLIKREELYPELNKVLPSLFYQNTSEPLTENLTENLYGSQLMGSVSRLESFAACPFQYFVQYGLKLKEREIYQVDAPLKGDFYHRALQKLVEEIQQGDRPWEEWATEDLVDLTHKITTVLIPELEHGIFLSTPRHQYWTKTMQQNLQTAVEVLTEHARLGTFQPAAVELAFGLKEGIPAVKIDLEDTRSLILRGRIDRIDLATIEEQAYLRVIDYKSSVQTLDLSQCYHGLMLQLPVYLNVALKYYKYFTDTAPKAAGMLNFPVRSPVIRSDHPLNQKEARDQLYQELKMRGWILADQELARQMGALEGRTQLLDIRLTKKGEFYKGSKVLDPDQLNVLRDFTLYKLKELAQGIYQGETSIAPYRLAQKTPCNYCDYRPCCQFDNLVPGNNYRTLVKLSDEELWASMTKLMNGGEING